MKEARRPKSLDVPLLYKLRSNKSCSLESPDSDVTKPQRVAFVTSDVLLLVDGWKFRRGWRGRKKGKPLSQNGGGVFIARPYTWGPSNGEESDGCDVTFNDNYDVTANSYDDEAFIEELEEGEVIPSPVVCKKKKIENKNLNFEDEDQKEEDQSFGEENEKFEVKSEIENLRRETIKTDLEKSEIVSKDSLERFDAAIKEELLNAEEDYMIVENLMSDMLDKICTESTDVKDKIITFNSNEAEQIFEEHDQVS